MKPFDARLLRYARSARRVLTVGAMLGLLRTLAIIAWSWCLAMAIATVAVPVIAKLPQAGGDGSRVAEGVVSLADLPWLLAGALIAVLVRAAAGWGMDLVAARGAVQVKSQLRTAALDALDAAGPDAIAAVPDSKLATTLGRGLDALDGYFSSYVPQLILAIVATPVLLAVVLFTDLTSGIIVLIVFPIIPIFMVLIGMATQAVQNRQWQQLQRLSASFLDVVEGLATLKIFRRESRQVDRIAHETGEYRSRTMRVLRVTFMSGFVLDLAGTFSIALVAVTVGTQLVAGEYPLALGLFVLLVLPEVFVPIRQVGAAFHASTEGLAASEDVFALIEGMAPTPSTATPRSRPTPEAPALVVDRLCVRRESGDTKHTVLENVTFEVRGGEVVALAGPSGAGKSTILSVALGFLEPTSGMATVAGRLAWAGQRPGLIQGTVLDNVAVGSSSADETLARTVLDAVGLTELPLDAALGALGAGLSGGQSQRVAVARALYRARALDARVVLLDEPTSALDTASEQRVIAAARAEAETGRAVLVVSHRTPVLEAADRVIHIDLPRNVRSHRVATEESRA